MKKQFRFIALFIIQLLSIHCILAKKQSEEFIDYAKAPKSRAAVTKAIEDSGNDCIDNVIGLLSELEQEQNQNQGAQQDAAACRLELNDFKSGKSKAQLSKHQDNETEINELIEERTMLLKENTKLEQTRKTLETELANSDHRVIAERKAHETAQIEIKKLQNSLQVNQQETEQYKKNYDLLLQSLKERDDAVQSMKNQLNANEKEFAQEKSALHDLQTVYINEKTAWQTEKSKLQEQINKQQPGIVDQTGLTNRIRELENLLAQSKEHAIVSTALEKELQTVTMQLHECQKEVIDAKTLKESADKKVQATQHQCENYKKLYERTAAQELEEAKTKEKNKALSTTIKSQMDSLIGQLNEIQQLYK